MTWCVCVCVEKADGAGYLAQKSKKEVRRGLDGPAKDQHPSLHCPHPCSPPTVQRARSLQGWLPPPADGPGTVVWTQGRVTVLRLCQRENTARQLEPLARRSQAKAFGARTLSPVTPCPAACELLWMCGRQRASCPPAELHPSWEPNPAGAPSLPSPLSRLSRNSAACSRTWMLLATGSMSAAVGGSRR